MDDVERGERILLQAIAEKWLAFEAYQLALVMTFFATFEQREDEDQAMEEVFALVNRLATKAIRLQVGVAFKRKADQDAKLASELEGGARHDEVMRQRALQYFAQKRGHG